jgi:hypothetical protein
MLYGSVLWSITLAAEVSMYLVGAALFLMNSGHSRSGGVARAAVQRLACMQG